MTAVTGLDYLRSRTIVDCDTMDAEGRQSFLKDDRESSYTIQSLMEIISG